MSMPQRLPDKHICVLGLWTHQILHANNVIQVGVFGIMLAWTLFHDGIRLAKVIQLDSMFMTLKPTQNNSAAGCQSYISYTMAVETKCCPHDSTARGCLEAHTWFHLDSNICAFSSFGKFNLYPFALLNWQSKNVHFKYLKCFYDNTQKRL